MGDNDEVILLDFWASMYGMRVRVALAEKQIKYEHREEDLEHGKSAQLLEMNPVHKFIPVLIHNGKAICESLVVVEYIDEVWKGNGTCDLLPSDPLERAQARFWADFTNKMYEFGRKVTWLKIREEQEKAKVALINSLNTLENGALGDRLYFGGDHFGYLDVAFVGFCSWFYIYEKLGHFKMEDECPKLMAWVKRCWEKETVSKSLLDPEKLCQGMLQIRKRLGLE